MTRLYSNTVEAKERFSMLFITLFVEKIISNCITKSNYV
jgi:hypothetical protein